MNPIDNIKFHELQAEKFWSFPSTFKGDKKAETRNMIFSGDYVGSRKMDGAYYRFIKDENGEMVLQGRSKGVGGDYLNKIEWVPQLQPFFDFLPKGTCLLGEVYFPNNEGSSNVTKIMGCLTQKARDRQEKGDKLHYYIFDVWAYDGRSLLNNKMTDRVAMLEEIRHYINLNYREEFQYIHFANYFEGAELWEELQRILEMGGEGVVITKKDSKPAPGKRTARKTLKIKKEITDTIDCFFTGRTTPPEKEYKGKSIEDWCYYVRAVTDERLEVKPHYNEMLRGEPIIPVTKSYYFDMAGSLEIGAVKDDKIVPIGLLSGLSEEIRSNPLDYKGKVIEVNCMEIQYHEDGRNPGLRHARMIQFRPDKNWRDCNWYDIFREE